MFLSACRRLGPAARRAVQQAVQGWVCASFQPPSRSRSLVLGFVQRLRLSRSSRYWYLCQSFALWIRRAALNTCLRLWKSRNYFFFDRNARTLLARSSEKPKLALARE